MRGWKRKELSIGVISEIFTKKESGTPGNLDLDCGSAISDRLNEDKNEEGTVRGRNLLTRFWSSRLFREGYPKNASRISNFAFNNCKEIRFNKESSVHFVIFAYVSFVSDPVSRADRNRPPTLYFPDHLPLAGVELTWPQRGVKPPDFKNNVIACYIIHHT